MSEPNIPDSPERVARGSSSATGSVWVVIQRDQLDLTDWILNPGYWTREAAHAHVNTMNQVERDSYTYHVREIKMSPTPND